MPLGQAQRLHHSEGSKIHGFYRRVQGLLVRNWDEGGAPHRATGITGKKLEHIDYEKALMDAGIDKGKANELNYNIHEELLTTQEEAYQQGIKDGFQLTLHSLGMVPEKLKGGLVANGIQGC